MYNILMNKYSIIQIFYFIISTIYLIDNIAQFNSWDTLLYSRMKGALLCFKDKTSLILSKKIIKISEGLKEIELDDNEGEVIKNIFNNYRICWHFYRTLWNLVAGNFFEFVLMVSSSRIEEKKKILNLVDGD